VQSYHEWKSVANNLRGQTVKQMKLSWLHCVRAPSSPTRRESLPTSGSHEAFARQEVSVRSNAGCRHRQQKSPMFTL